jgi:hypothetical protein
MRKAETEDKIEPLQRANPGAWDSEQRARRLF